MGHRGMECGRINLKTINDKKKGEVPVQMAAHEERKKQLGKSSGQRHRKQTPPGVREGLLFVTEGDSQQGYLQANWGRKWWPGDCRLWRLPGRKGSG